MSDLRTFRATGVTIVFFAIVVVLVVVTAVVGLSLPESMSFTPEQTATIWFLIALVAFFAWTVARSRVTADDEHIVAVNGWKTYDIAWSQVRKVHFGPGDPWPTLLLDDDERVALFAIQGTEGKSATEAIAWLRTHVRPSPPEA